MSPDHLKLLSASQPTTAFLFTVSRLASHHACGQQKLISNADNKHLKYLTPHTELFILIQVIRYTYHYSEGVFVCFGHSCSLQKILGQGSNLCRSSDPSHSRDDARFLTH